MKNLINRMKNVYFLFLEWAKENVLVIINVSFASNLMFVVAILNQNSKFVQSFLVLLFWSKKEEAINFSTVTVLIAAGTYLLTRKKHKADLVSKSRIDWLKESRSLSTEILQYSDTCASKAETFITYKNYLIRDQIKNEIEQKKAKDLFPKLLDEFNESNFLLKKNVHQFKMQFGINKKNDNFIELATKLLNEIFEYNQLMNEYMNSMDSAQSKSVANIVEQKKKKLNLKFNDTMKEFITESRVYYKNEWDRAKKGK